MRLGELQRQMRQAVLDDARRNPSAWGDAPVEEAHVEIRDEGYDRAELVVTTRSGREIGWWML